MPGRDGQRSAGREFDQIAIVAGMSDQPGPRPTQRRRTVAMGSPTMASCRSSTALMKVRLADHDVDIVRR